MKWKTALYGILIVTALSLLAVLVFVKINNGGFNKPTATPSQTAKATYTMIATATDTPTPILTSTLTETPTATGTVTKTLIPSLQPVGGATETPTGGFFIPTLPGNIPLPTLPGNIPFPTLPPVMP